MLSKLSLHVIGVVTLLLQAPLSVFADCECGYSLNETESSSYAVFTEIFESDFTTLSNMSENTDWIIQHWNVSKEKSNGPYGRVTELANVVSKPSITDNKTLVEENIKGGPAGLELWVRKTPPGASMVPVAEVDSKRMDMLYGSFRAAFETTSVKGTCAAFFWYLNDTQEIDMEFLSAQMNETYSPVNLVLHSKESMARGSDAKDTPGYKLRALPFQPSEGIHEYRFDWRPGSVSFFADGEWLMDITGEDFVPDVGGKLILSHWSNGQPLWSSGPPEEDAKLLVKYVKAYFNSSDPARQRDYASRCHDSAAENAICGIPDNANSDMGYFFSKDANKTNNQTVFGKETSAASCLTTLLGPSLLVSLAVILLTSFA